jgi:hypothetical protein
MILLRRLFALLLVPVAITSILAVTVVLRVNETLLEPQFWVDQLRAADVYEETYSKILPAAIAAASEDASDDLTSGPDFDFTRFNADIVRIAREVVPPEWIQDQVESALLTVSPYLLGEEDSFSLTIQFGDRIQAAATALKRETKNEAVYGPLYEESIGWAAEKVVEGAEDIEIPIQVTSDEATGYLRRVLPPAWLQSSIDDAVDSALPYLLGSADEFEVTIALGERVDPLAQVLRDVLGKTDLQGLIIEEVVMPTVSQNLNGGIDIVSGVQLGSDEILESVRETLTPDWVAEIQEEIINDFADYLTGRTDTFESTIELGDRKGQVIGNLLPRVEAELASQFDRLPECIIEQARDVDFTDNRLPECRPPEFDYARFISESDVNPIAELTRAIQPLIPDEFDFGEAQLREVAGPEASETLDDVRESARDGLKFSHEDILGNLDPEDIVRFDEVRADLRDGFTLTEEDFEDALTEASVFISTVDRVRGWISIARGLAPLAWMQVAFFLVLVGALGGRNWGSRLGWAFVTLGIGTGVLWATSGPLYDGLGSTGWNTARDEALAQADSEVGRLGIELGLIFVRTVTNEFNSGLASTGLMLLIIAGAGFAIAVVLQATGGSRRRAKESRQADAVTADR